jgi:CRP/FNR family transcriptional regulator
MLGRAPISSIAIQAFQPVVQPGSTGRGRKLRSSVQDICELLGMSEFDVPVDANVVFQHAQFKAGQRVHMAGQKFDSLYIVYSGFLKSVSIDESGNEQIMHFLMKGDLFGIDGIYRKQFSSESVALTDCEIILIPFKTLTLLGNQYPQLEAATFEVISGEIVKEQALLNVLSKYGAEARVAHFILWLSERFSAMGYSGMSFNLRMTREEIGSYLGITLETVSRTLSAFNTMGLISVQGKSVAINDITALRNLRNIPLRKR